MFFACNIIHYLGLVLWLDSNLDSLAWNVPTHFMLSFKHLSSAHKISNKFDHFIRASYRMMLGVKDPTHYENPTRCMMRSVMYDSVWGPLD